MVRGRTDKIFIRLNNKAAQLEHDSRFDPCLFRFLDDQTDEILTLIVHGETDQVEFKEGACFNPHTKKPDKKGMPQKILNEVAAFMNSQDKGTLLIGVADDGTIPGIEREYSAANPQKANWDGYELFLTNLLNDSLSPANPNDFYNISKHVVNGKIICAINTTKANEPVLAKEKLFLRSGTTATELNGRDKVNFIRNWT
jgi:predicted HTH transcriptional regulator